MEIHSLSDLFEYELDGTYYVENRLVDELDGMAARATHEEVSRAFEAHRDETREHVDRLERVFELLGRTPAEAAVRELDGLIEDRERFDASIRDDDLRDMYYLGAAARAERLEIASYRTLLMHVDKLDLGNEVRKPLEDTLDEEEETLHRLRSMAGGSKLGSLIRRLTG
ncbi:YciE/YciF ferroxidase family protein [Halegenticoccus tardaugens]|uniref:YciE/YciF ferroxidase family protein n=1 Tax=Halegenticoccus tardaugens TaxID=2071624 RepID=UPI0013E987DE|nr:DUF892 family protein [Halegenticoccus tardaugens]